VIQKLVGPEKAGPGGRLAAIGQIIIRGMRVPAILFASIGETVSSMFLSFWILSGM